jgi:uncharacterized protein (UPF0261 family)
MRQIYVVGTADTKGAELRFLAQTIRGIGGVPVIVDVGLGDATITPDIPAAEVASYGVSGLLHLRDRGAAVSAMADAFARFMAKRDDVRGVIGIGGSGGTAIVTAGMRALPIGVPKLMVSTLASGDTAPYVGVSDIVMMPSITDLAGLNRISRVILAQAAAAITAMAATPLPAPSPKPSIGLTMFGVTTPAVTKIMAGLGDGVEGMVFHATGTGGRSMEALVDSGYLTGVIDITTTEVADLLCGGKLPAGPDRLDCIARTRVPYVGSVGACDMVNFWAPDTVPDHYKNRLFHRHNANVTLMRTNAAECAAIGAWIAEKLNRCDGPVEVLLPMGGISALDVPGGAFWDPGADAALFDALEGGLHQTATRRVTRLPHHINDDGFANAVVAAYAWITA